MIRGAILALTLVTSVMWLGLVMSVRHVPDRVCPTGETRVRYPEHLADYHDGKGDMKHYRIASCKPTGIDWREAP